VEKLNELLHAMPEVQCCVRCQDRRERLGRRA
jgi:RNA polymerase-binding transcription factor DksA